LPYLAQVLTIGTTKTQSFLELVSSGVTQATAAPMTRIAISTAFVILMAILNFPVMLNLIAPQQVMNGSFDKLRLVNTYGAFGTVGETRVELIIESACDIGGPWKEYQFKVKPGDVYRRPPWISPYHHRLDWQIWIASQMRNVERSPWLYSFLLKLLNQESYVIRLIENDPWKDNGCPKFIRIEKYQYKFYNRQDDLSETSGTSERTKSQYWTRERVGRFFPRQGVMTAAMLKELVD
jgi:hypothetical protein